MLAPADAGSDERRTLTELLRCPACGATVSARAEVADCARGHAFRVVDGVVVMVEDGALASDPQYEAQRRYFDREFASHRGCELERWRISYLNRLRVAGVLDGPLVDVGVGGSGYTVIEAARAGQLAVGCDLSLAGLVAARRLAIVEGIAERTLWVCCSAEKLPFADGAFASALAVAVIEHVPDDEAALAEIGRVLCPGGRAWITVPHALRHISPLLRPPNRRHDRRLGHLRRYEAEALADAGRRVGLDATEAQFTGHPVKILQLAIDKLARGRLATWLWWWLESRDLAAARRRRGSMQLSIAFTRRA
jgi:SAM-dependent methyltransferase